MILFKLKANMRGKYIFVLFMLLYLKLYIQTVLGLVKERPSHDK